MLQIPKSIFKEIKKHSMQDNPIEACGYLAGVNNKIVKIIRMTNIDKSKEHFSFDPVEQFKVVKDMRKQGLKLLGVYHSHPETPARMSEEDKRLLVDPELWYLIYSIKYDELKAFKRKKNEIIEDKIEIIEGE